MNGKNIYLAFDLTHRINNKQINQKPLLEKIIKDFKNRIVY